MQADIDRIVSNTGSIEDLKNQVSDLLDAI
jgi:hypothetical protein